VCVQNDFRNPSLLSVCAVDSTSRGCECPSCLCTLRMIRLQTEASRPDGGPSVAGQCLTNVESAPCSVATLSI
jgi:hypothetical protein